MQYEVMQITGLSETHIHRFRGGVGLQGSWQDALRLNLHSRLGMRVMVQLAQGPYDSEQAIHDRARTVNWDHWFTPRESFRVDEIGRAHV